MTLWTVVVAERLGQAHEEAPTLDRAVTGLNAYPKPKAIGLIKPTDKESAEKNVGGEARPVGRTAGHQGRYSAGRLHCRPRLKARGSRTVRSSSIKASNRTRGTARTRPVTTLAR